MIYFSLNNSIQSFLNVFLEWINYQIYETDNVSIDLLILVHVTILLQLSFKLKSLFISCFSSDLLLFYILG